MTHEPAVGTPGPSGPTPHSAPTSAPRGAVLVLAVALAISGWGCAGEPQAASGGDQAASSGVPAPTTPPPASPGPDIFLADLSRAGGPWAVSNVRNVTNRPGYDNQPSFTPDGSALLYTEGTPDSRTNVVRYTLSSGARAPVEATADQSEYSGVVPPDGEGVVVIRVEADSLQRLWRIGSPLAAPVFTDLAPVGYHAWVDEEHVGMFVLGDPNTFRLGNPSTQEVRIVTERIGRSLQRYPGRRAISFVSVPDSVAMIQLLDVDDGSVSPLMPALEGSEDLAWTSDGTALMGRGATLYARHPDDDAWMPIADLSTHGENLTRIAVHPEGHTVALVMEPLGARP